MTTPTRTPDVSCIIVTWEGWDLLEACLQSVRDGGAGRAAVEVIVVDNASSDGTGERLCERFPHARHVPLESNVGFAAANNRGVEQAGGDLIFLLNNDTVVQPGAIDMLVEAASTHPSFDIFAPQMLRLADPSTVDNRGVYLTVSGYCRQLDAGTPETHHRDSSEIFGASGGACLVRRKVITEIGLFDEAMGSYQEDCDFACRARAAGHRCLYVPEARIHHVGSATGDRLPERKLYQIQRNRRIVKSRWTARKPWSMAYWIGKAHDAYRFVQVPSRQWGVLIRANRDARRFPSPENRWATSDSRRRVAEWIGVHTRPVEGLE